MSIWEISERERLPIGILRETGMTSRFYFLLFSFTLQVSACLLEYSGGFRRAVLGQSRRLLAVFV
jgi:hypothetical protein